MMMTTPAQPTIGVRVCERRSLAVPNECYYTGKRTTFGNIVARSGAAIKKGGFGLHTSGVSRRKFKPNLQKMQILDENGVPRRVKVSTRAIKSGMVTKPLKRKYGYTRQQKEAAGDEG